MQAILRPTTSVLSRSESRDLARVVAATTLGFALYGFTTGFWRSPLMGLYVAVKMPLLIACTLACNGLLNGLLGILLGSNLGFRQSLQALLSAFAISGLILGSVAPVTFFLALNAPPPDSPQAASAHAGYLLFHTAIIAIAGLIGLARLHGLLENYCPSRTSARTTLAAWVAGNAFLGAQFSWILRPFFGSPNLDVAFLRPDPLQGSFYEAVWRSSRHFIDRVPPELLLASIALILTACLIARALLPHHAKPNSTP
ncbi:MAG: hypothetical protein MUF31_11100 [Akkermansiaceae bacterium]|jgi:hypothetical protein|nr:hypothetical protein [Akkermansiaceae bacterium]